MPKNKKIIETTGKVDQIEPTRLEQIFGFNELARYGTIDEHEYNSKLREMNRSDLETEARRVGVVVVENTERLRKLLEKEFTNYLLASRKPVNPNKQVTKVSKIAQSILNEGR